MWLSVNLLLQFFLLRYVIDIAGEVMSVTFTAYKFGQIVSYFRRKWD